MDDAERSSADELGEEESEEASEMPMGDRHEVEVPSVIFMKFVTAKLSVAMASSGVLPDWLYTINPTCSPAGRSIINERDPEVPLFAPDGSEIFFANPISS